MISAIINNTILIRLTEMNDLEDSHVTVCD